MTGCKCKATSPNWDEVPIAKLDWMYFERCSHCMRFSRTFSTQSCHDLQSNTVRWRPKKFSRCTTLKQAGWNCCGLSWLLVASLCKESNISISEKMHSSPTSAWLFAVQIRTFRAWDGTSKKAFKYLCRTRIARCVLSIQLKQVKTSSWCTLIYKN